MLNRLRAIFGGQRPHAELAEPTAWSVEQVEPRLRMSGGYPRRYQDAVARALEHCQGLAIQMREPVPVGRTEYQRNPLVRALFPGGDEIPLLLSKSQAVRTWLRDNQGEDFVALMGVRLREKQTLGMALEGDAVRRDVARTVAVFSDHTFTALGPDAGSVRGLLEREFLASLLEQVRGRIQALRLLRDELERRRSGLQKAQPGPSSAELRDELDRCLEELREVSAGLDLVRYPEHFQSVLLQPEHHVALHPTRVAVDPLGVCSLAPPEPEHVPVELCELAGRDRRHWMVTLVHCRRSEMEAAPDFSSRLAEAGRWLLI